MGRGGGNDSSFPRGPPACRVAPVHRLPRHPCNRNPLDASTVCLHLLYWTFAASTFCSLSGVSYFGCAWGCRVVLTPVSPTATQVAHLVSVGFGGVTICGPDGVSLRSRWSLRGVSVWSRRGLRRVLTVSRRGLDGDARSQPRGSAHCTTVPHITVPHIHPPHLSLGVRVGVGQNDRLLNAAALAPAGVPAAAQQWLPLGRARRTGLRWRWRWRQRGLASPDEVRPPRAEAVAHIDLLLLGAQRHVPPPLWCYLGRARALARGCLRGRHPGTGGRARSRTTGAR
eukprot:5458071-Pyramimonas_sp.AAC.1